MKWIKNIFAGESEGSAPRATASTNEERNQSSVAQRTNLLIKIKKREVPTNGEIQKFKDSGGSLDEIINKQTNENLLDRAISLKNQPAIDALKKHGAHTSREKMNEVIKETPAANKIELPTLERTRSGYTTEEDRSSRSSSVDSSQQPPAEKWKEANPKAAKIADDAREDRINEIEKNKNQPIVIPKINKIDVAAEMERQLQERQAAARKANTGKMNFKPSSPAR